MTTPRQNSKNSDANREGWKPPADAEPGLELYRRASELAAAGRLEEARRHYGDLQARVADKRLRALICSDLAALAAAEEDLPAAVAGFRGALAIDGSCEPARANLALLQSLQKADKHGSEPRSGASSGPAPAKHESPCKVAILSFLFNWPSTGGGIVDTVELAEFLACAGYDVKHVFVRKLSWGVGRVEDPSPIASEVPVRT